MKSLKKTRNVKPEESTSVDPNLVFVWDSNTGLFILTLIAAIIDDPNLSHRISVSLIFVLYAATIWTVAKIFIHNKVFALVAALISLNLFFNVVSVTEVYPLPKSNFNYFQLMPPQNFIFLLAIYWGIQHLLL